MLTRVQSSWTCCNNHHFDIAKEGYVNLLLANQKRTKEPGDNNDMINARRAFLERDYYLPLAEKLANLIRENTSPSQEMTLYDIGCGEGYYLDRVRQSLQQHNINPISGGSDIAKNAIQKASKKYKNSHFAVASNANLPIASNQVDALLQVFAPVNQQETLRVLSNSGIWLQVSPGAEHLQELKKQIYSTPEEHQPSNLDIAGFNLAHQEILTYKVDLEELTDRKHLLMMTPFYWSTDQEKIDITINNLNSITISFHIKIFAKTPIQ
jgi:23S rRNA (guanine745-N1)-methyltransferase